VLYLVKAAKTDILVMCQQPRGPHPQCVH